MFGIKVLTLQPKPINETRVMNENIDLTKILKNCPKGTKLYSTIFGAVEFCYIDESDKYPIKLNVEGECDGSVTADGKHYVDFNGECTLFPSKEQQDWSKFTAPWYKKERFDPKTLKPFDKVLIRNYNEEDWCCGSFSHVMDENNSYVYVSGRAVYKQCIPYNDDTKHLIGIVNEAPEYYRYWED